MHPSSPQGKQSVDDVSFALKYVIASAGEPVQAKKNLPQNWNDFFISIPNN
jgi:hypothetical protein